MPVTVNTELYIQATPADVAAALAPDASSDLALALEGSWYLAPWTPTLDSWRHDVSWRRGRARGSGTIDLLSADAARTLVVVSLTTRARSLRGALPGEAALLARRLRTAAERGDAVRVGARPEGATTGVRVERPVATAVGYSGP